MSENVSLEQVLKALESDDYIGFCLACGAEAYGVEPDASRYTCESCQESEVYGAETFEIGLDVIARGLEVLANYCPRHFADLVNENGDRTTADALLQCCTFGEIVYG